MTDQRTEAQTDEHPIIFNGWSIRHILADEKTQTRRVVKPQPPSDVCSVMWDGMGRDWIGTVGSRNDPIRWSAKCPYGQPGDVLWVREAFRLPEWADETSPAEYASCRGKDAGEMPVRYEADGRAAPFHDRVTVRGWGRKRLSIHMPRALCHLRLRVENVRVERVQEISEDDAMAEGVEPVTRQSTSVHDGDKTSACAVFKELWNDIHGDGSWEENPWVWVISFSKLDK
jgi:hypothetical protein